MWNAAEETARYEAWYASDKGGYALACERRLIASLVSAWPRRGHSLLEIGCGAGHFLELFHSAGFDVTGLDSSLPMLDAAKNRMGLRATLRFGQAEHLPFDDGAFDFAAMVTSLEYMKNPEVVLREAFRVASKGVIIVFFNSWSLYRLEQYGRSLTRIQAALKRLRPRLRPAKPESAPEQEKPGDHRRGRTPEQAHWHTLVGMLKTVYKSSGKHPQCIRSALFSPSFLWRSDRTVCSGACALPFGAVVGLRVDLTPVCVTPIVLPAGKVMPVAR